MGKRGEHVAELVRLLLDFDPWAVEPADALVGWKVIAQAVGFSVDTLQAVATRAGIKLPRWGYQGSTTPVFLPKARIVVLRQIMMTESRG